MKQVGDKIPAYLGVDQDGNEVTAEQMKGKTFLLYFYPKDNTSGCTAEACSLRDTKDVFDVDGIEVIGVSKDSAKSHQNFIEKHQLPFKLIADTEHKLQEDFGVWVEKSMYGRKYMGTQRSSFLVGPDGKILHTWVNKEVKTKTHGEQVLKVLTDLGIINKK